MKIVLSKMSCHLRVDVIEKLKSPELYKCLLGRHCNEAAMQGPTSYGHMAVKTSGLNRTAIEDMGVRFAN